MNVNLSECRIAFPITGTCTYAELMAAIAAGCADVYAASGRLADTLRLSRDRYFYIQGLTTEAWPGGKYAFPILRVVVDSDMSQGQIVVAHNEGMASGDPFSCALITVGEE